MLRIIMPMAGSSDIFAHAGYIYPKPLIEMNGSLMVQEVLNHLSTITTPHNFIFIIKEEDCVNFHLDNTLKLLNPNSTIIKLKKNTKGALCSVLMAIDALNSEDELLILNSDQVITENFSTILDSFYKSKADAGIVTFKSVHPRWSYARIEHDIVLETAEKNPISHHAIAGFYFFKEATTFLKNAFQTILNDVHHGGTYFVSSVMNQYILDNKTVVNYTITPNQYHSFYSPQMVTEYEKRFAFNP